MTPLLAEQWRAMLADHPDRALAARLVDGIRHGVDLHYRSDSNSARLVCRNLTSADKHAAAVDRDLAVECAAGRKAGPFDSPPLPGFIVSPLGCVAKKNGKQRVIHHLSFPHGGDSVNAAVEVLECKLASFDRAIELVQAAGRGCFLTKIDIDGAYRNIPTHPSQWHVLGMRWRGKFYYDRVLPFGLRSSCAIWEEYATAAEWIISRVLALQSLMHYIDDYLVVHPAGDQARAAAVRDLVLRVFKLLGVPIAMPKLEGPVTALTYLGILLDTVTMTARLDATRLDELRALLAAWATKATCTRKELQSLVGKLTFATRVVRPGRLFTVRMFALLAATHDRTVITLSPEFALDLAWWQQFITRWNGISLLCPAAPTVIVHTDACGSGFGAHVGSSWTEGRWTADEHALALGDDAAAESMPYLELRALVIAACTWASRWAGALVEFRCDCMPVVAAAGKQSSHQPRMAAMLRILHHTAATHNFEFCVAHIAGADNYLADALSRGGVKEFLTRHPSADRSVTTPQRPPTLRC